MLDTHRLRLGVFCWFLLLGCALPQPGRAQVSVLDPNQRRVDLPAPQPPNPLVVDHAKHLFADDWVVARREGLERTLHAVKKHPENPLLRPEMPWEKPAVLLYGAVMYDPHRDEDRFRMWYLCYTPEFNDDYSVRKNKNGRICYAISRDGIEWRRPELGIHEYAGSKKNNIVIVGEPGISSFHYDPRDPDPARRYKAMVRNHGHRAYFSPDGIHWTEYGRTNLDAYDRSTVHWNPIEERWFASTKNWFKNPGGEDRRGRGYAESENFVDWGPVSFLCATPEDAPNIVYGLEVFYYESMFFGLWDRYTAEPDALLDVQLAVSHNARHWRRPSNQAWIPLAPLPQDYGRAKSTRSPVTGVDPFDPRVPWDYANNSASNLGPIRVGDELRVYYSGRATDHKSRPHVGAIGLGTLRLDGFFSLDAGESDGTLLTRPVRLVHDQLRMNANAEGGRLLVEIQDESGSPLAPYTTENCVPLTSDSVRHRVAWQGASDLSALVGKTVRLKFTLQNAELYSFWTGEERLWHTPDTTTWLRR